MSKTVDRAHSRQFVRSAALPPGSAPEPAGQRRALPDSLAEQAADGGLTVALLAFNLEAKTTLT